jgi:addiction module RelE/StbE family toxin
VIVFDEQALADLERIFEFNFERDPATALDHIDKIRSAVLILDMHPRIGRLLGGGSTLRELIISHGKSGYVALYEHSEVAKRVRIIAIRHQREAGYRDR